MESNKIDFNKSLHYPVTDADWIVKILIGCALSFFSWLVIPGMMTYGYFVKAIRDAANGNDATLPEWDDWGVLLKVGCFITLAMMMLGLVPVTLMGVGIVATFGSIFLGHTESAWFGALGGGVGAMILLAGLAFVFVFLAFAPMLMLRYSISGDFGDFFAFGAAWQAIMLAPLEYLKILLFPMLASFAVAIVVGMTAGLGSILAVPLGFMITLITAHMQGTYYRLYMQ